MTNKYKQIADESGHLQFTRVNQAGRKLIMIQNLPDSHTDVGMHYSAGSVYVDLAEAETLIRMLADELNLDVMLTHKIVNPPTEEEKKTDE